MKIYYHPASTTCRPLMLFAAETGLDIEFQLVDLFKGEQLQTPYATMNPSCQVPMLEDGDFRLTESSAILKYLAEKSGTHFYTDKRPRVSSETAILRSDADAWIGTPTGRPPYTLGNSGRKVIGIYGRQGLILDAVGLVLEYLWRSYVDTVNTGILRHGGGGDRQVVATELIR